MGATPRSPLALNLKGMFPQDGSTCKPWKQSINTNMGGSKWSPRSRKILKKRWAFLERPRRPTTRIEKSVQTLKRLVPNRKPMGLDGLFNVTADHIMRLQKKVKVMQMMVKLLSKAEE